MGDNKSKSVKSSGVLNRMNFALQKFFNAMSVYDEEEKIIRQELAEFAAVAEKQKIKKVKNFINKINI